MRFFLLSSTLMRGVSASANGKAFPRRCRPFQDVVGLCPVPSDERALPSFRPDVRGQTCCMGLPTDLFVQERPTASFCLGCPRKCFALGGRQAGAADSFCFGRPTTTVRLWRLFALGVRFDVRDQTVCMELPTDLFLQERCLPCA